MSTTNKSAIKPAIKPVGRLDASLLLARKGEAQPAVAATTQNNPSLAWGVYTPPADAHHPAAAHGTHGATMHDAAQQTQEVQGAHQTPPHAQPRPFGHGHKPTASARLRPDSFAAHRTTNAMTSNGGTHKRTGPQADRDPVALTLRVEDNAYLRLTYLAQITGKSVQQVLNIALEGYLIENGLPASRKLVVRPK